MADKKVLIVDDEETLTWSMSKSLAKDKEKYDVLTANNGKEALDMMRQHDIDLAILDIRMPGINGLDLLVIIKKKYERTKVIIMTAYGSRDIQKEASRRGSLYYIEKPFEIKDMRRLILDSIGEKDEPGFEGQVRGLQLADIIQMNCLGRITTALIITQGNLKGTIYFKGGEIVHAEYGDVSGEPAFYQILNWESGNFSFQNGALPDRETINARWEFLLMEGMRLRDENQKVVDKNGVSGEFKIDKSFYEKQIETGDLQGPSKEAIAAAREQPQAKGKISLPDVSHRLRQIKGCMGSIFLDAEGNVLHADRREKDMSRETPIIKPMNELIDDISQNFPLGMQLRTAVHYNKLQKVITKKDDIYVIIYLTPDTSYDEIQLLIKRNLDRI